MGLSLFDALQTCTRAAAEFMGDDSVGIIAVGKRADLLILKANPLINISNTRKRFCIVFCGQWFPQKELDVQLETLAASFSKPKNHVQIFPMLIGSSIMTF